MLGLLYLKKAEFAKYGFKDGFRFKMQVKDNSTKTILERCFDEVYKINASKLLYDQKKKMWKLNLSYSFDNKNISELDKEKILGVDVAVGVVGHAAIQALLDTSGAVQLNSADLAVDNSVKDIVLVIVGILAGLVIGVQDVDAVTRHAAGHAQLASLTVDEQVVGIAVSSKIATTSTSASASRWVTFTSGTLRMPV